MSLEVRGKTIQHNKAGIFYELEILTRVNSKDFLPYHTLYKRFQDIFFYGCHLKSTLIFFIIAALLQVSSSVRIPRNIMPLCLPDNTDFYKQGARCSITGWGHTSFNGSLSKVLREAWVDLVPLNECNSKQ